MKNLITIVFLFLLNFNALSQIKGIQFQQNITWEQVLLIAKQEKKIIFLDAYTTWCNPCKYMNKYIFTDEEVGKFYNNQFVNFKIDMETKEGIEIKKRYHITSYPSLLWIDSTGKIVKKHIGMIKKPNDFLHQTRVMLNASNSASYFSQQEFDNGKRDEQFLIQHIKNLMKEKESVSETVSEFIRLYSPLSLDKESHLIVYCLDSSSNYLEHELTKKFQKNAAEYREKFSEQLVLIRLKSMFIVHNGLTNAINKESKEELEIVLDFIKEYLKDKKPSFTKKKIRSYRKKYRKGIKKK